MTNEEKILELLEQHGALLERMDKRLDKLEDTQAKQGEQLQKQGDLLQKVDERSQRTALLMEVDFQRKLDLLYEGHQTIMEAITPKERIEELEADVSVLKMAVRSLAEELKELKKAQ